MATKQNDLSAISTGSVIDVLNIDDYAESSEASESENDYASETTSNSCHRTENKTDQETDSEQGNKIVSSSSSSVSSLLSVLRNPRLSDLTRKRKVQANSGGKRKKTDPP